MIYSCNGNSTENTYYSCSYSYSFSTCYIFQFMLIQFLHHNLLKIKSLNYA